MRKLSEVAVVHIPYEDLEHTAYEPYMSEEVSGYDTEQMIFLLGQAEVTVLLFRYLGYTPPEITNIMQLRNVRRCYRISRKLKKHATQIANSMNRSI